MCIYLGGFDFDGPYPLSRWNPPHEDGVYVVMRSAMAADGTPDGAPALCVLDQRSGGAGECLHRRPLHAGRDAILAANGRDNAARVIPSNL
jgi:hypothetical protein